MLFEIFVNIPSLVLGEIAWLVRFAYSCCSLVRSVLWASAGGASRHRGGRCGTAALKHRFKAVER